MLRIEQLRVGYGSGTVLHDLHLHTAAGTVHAIVGHNGAGKTTLIHSIAGLLTPRRGRVLLNQRDITAMSIHRRVRAGIALVPQGRRIFSSLTVAEHLAVAYRRPRRAANAQPPWTRDRVLALLPQLARRLTHRGGQLSGGEQQMLAIARSLLTQPRLLLLDEPTEGLAPTLMQQVQELVGQLAGSGELTILLTASRPDLAGTADHTTVLEAGRIVSAVRSGDDSPLRWTVNGRLGPLG